MQKIDDLMYKSGNVIIEFIPVIGTSLYEFQVPDNESLTERLKNSVKRKNVFFDAIPHCAIALFKIIEKDLFTDLTSEEEMIDLVKRFKSTFQEEVEFDVYNCSKPYQPHFCVVISNEIITLYIRGEGRTLDEAEAVALKKILH